MKAWWRNGPLFNTCYNSALCAALSPVLALSISGWAFWRPSTIATTGRRPPALLLLPLESLMTDTNKNPDPNATPAPAPAEATLQPAPLAYLNPEFLNSPDGRILRILSEYAEPLSRFRHEKIQDTVVFFGSARFSGVEDAQQKLAGLQKPAAETPGVNQTSAKIEAAKQGNGKKEMASLPNQPTGQN